MCLWTRIRYMMSGWRRSCGGRDLGRVGWGERAAISRWLRPFGWGGGWQAFLYILCLVLFLLKVRLDESLLEFFSRDVWMQPTILYEKKNWMRFNFFTGANVMQLAVSTRSWALLHITKRLLEKNLASVCCTRLEGVKGPAQAHFMLVIHLNIG
jgi:hypothetical protein